MKNRSIVLAVGTIALVCAARADAAFLVLPVPADSAPLVAFGEETGQKFINDVIFPNYLDPIGSVEIYKATPGDSDEGLLAGDYDTEFRGGEDDVNDATVSLVGGATAIADATHLLVKGGNDPNEPNWYLFDISGWDGIEDLCMQDFWVGPGGSISHITLYGGSDQPPPPPPPGEELDLPEPASLLVWTALGAIGLIAARRRRRAARS